MINLTNNPSLDGAEEQSDLFPSPSNSVGPGRDSFVSDFNFFGGIDQCFDKKCKWNVLMPQKHLFFQTILRCCFVQSKITRYLKNTFSFKWSCNVVVFNQKITRCLKNTFSFKRSCEVVLFNQKITLRDNQLVTTSIVFRKSLIKWRSSLNDSP